VRFADRLAALELLDTPATALSAVADRLIPEGPVRRILRGSWLGHPFHPAATDVPIGAWLSASVLDLLGGERSHRAADGLVAFGVATALPTAASGLSDWSEIERAGPRRVGVVHALANSTALGLYGASLVARIRGDRPRGVLLGLAGLSAVSAGGFLGGHLAYGEAVGVSQEAVEGRAS
jgi:uncharacterized membrane protein